MHDYVVDRLNASKGKWSDIALGSTVPKRTLEKIARREIENPGVKHIQQLADYFAKVGTRDTPKRARKAAA